MGFLQRLFGRPLDASAPELASAKTGGDDDFSWLCPPSTLIDPAPWNAYWRDQITHRVAGLVDMFCNDGDLVDAMRANGLRTVLCVGNGLSMEPRALAWAGFDVTVLDLSPYAMDAVKRVELTDELLARLVGGRSAGANGTVEIVVGNLCDVLTCPGPYDVVIDRRTLQLFPDQERPAAIQAVANRLASRGIFFSQCHDGRWRPPAPPRHATRSWFVNEGWKMWQNDSPLAGRVAWLYTTTG